MTESLTQNLPNKGRTWRCYPGPLSAWQKSLGWFLAAITLFEASIAAKVFRLPHPILIGVLVASSVPAIFPLRAIRRAPRMSLADGELVFSAPWTTPFKPDIPSRFPYEEIDIAAAGVVEVDQRSDLQIVESSSNGSGAVGGATTGWRRLANGRMAHVSLCPGRPALYLPLRGGFAFLLAIRHATELLDELRERSRQVA